MPQKLLVTGGCGFIGSNFIRFLLEKEDVEIVNLDALTYAGNPENLRDIENSEIRSLKSEDDNIKYHVSSIKTKGQGDENKTGIQNSEFRIQNSYTFIHGRIEDKELVDRIFSEHKVDGVINFAAESHVDRSIMDASPFIDTNINGTFVLLEAARKYNVNRFLQVSTDEVYGTLGTTGKFTEESPLKPNSPYSASKAAADHLVMAYFKTYGLPAIITRCSNNYGPFQFPEKLIPLMILNALEDKNLPVYGDGMHVRDWIHVNDHIRGIWSVFQKAKIGEVYNIGGNCEKHNIDIVSIILNKLNKPESLIKFVPDRLGHDRRYAIDCSKIMNELGWKPEIDFEKGIEDTINWYLNNKDWTDNVRSGAYLDYYKKQYGSGN
jgi:dTDP-glucose 4,6-dehydratase